MQNKTLKEILEMDTKSDEFFEIYKKVSDKYWNFENPDELQKCAKTLVKFAERFDSDKVILATTVIIAVMDMNERKSEAATGNLVFGNTQYYFDIYESEVKKDGFNNMLKKAHSAMIKGKVTVKNQRGKRFF